MLERELFHPSRVTGIALRRNVNGDFAASYEHILAACAEEIDISEKHAQALVDRIRSGSRETPYLYVLHFDLLQAIEDDRLDDAKALIDRILSLDPAEPGILLTSLGANEFPWDSDAVADTFSAEEELPFEYAAPDPSLVSGRKLQVEAALELIRRAAPDLAAEMEEVITAIILAEGVQSDGKPSPVPLFAGASALRAFGATILEANPDHSAVDCAATLIHEEAHSLLYALSPMEGVVTNPDDERHASPLREDRRPLEGIYHATFVTARVVYGMEIMIASGHLDPDERDAANQLLARNQPRFFDGLTTLRRHADLTPQGAAALEAAESYMGQLSPEVPRAHDATG